MKVMQGQISDMNSITYDKIDNHSCKIKQMLDDVFNANEVEYGPLKMVFCIQRS
jgi:hypothetical protein